jgi:D-alanyl-D-alanine carboxypeptidase (penicillin-binding protein 5/6)
MMKKVILFLFIISIVLCGIVSNTYAKDIKLDCIAGVVIDQDSGRVLYDKNGDKVLPMASTTKIITAIVAIEKGNLSDVVVVSKTASSIGGSTVGLKAGEKITMEELLYGLMLRSGNDSAIAIAEHIGGSLEKFSKLMNDKALELGAYNTSFVTPHGLDRENHYTTARELAKITAYTMKNEVFAQIVSTKSISSGITGNFNRSYANINKFLYRLDNSDGVKTGFTGNAGKCLVASVKHPYGRYICVVLNSSDRWKDAERLVEYADKNYSFIKIFNKEEAIKRYNIYGGNQKYITGRLKSDLYLPVLANEMDKYKIDIYAPSVLFSPINENEAIGNVVVSIDEKIVAKYPVFSDRDVKRKNFIDIIKNIIFQFN